MNQSPEFIASIGAIADRYDAFILDLWGVIHDGRALYPGVRESLEQFRNRNKKVLLLSNAPRRALQAQKVLDSLGVERHWYDGLLTSGEVAYACLEQRPDAFFEALGSRYYYLGPEKDLMLADGSGCAQTDRLREAAFLLNVGFEYDHQPMEELRPVLKEALKLNLPMLCANPDLIVVRQSGERLECAGLLAQEYEQMGGLVRYLGKPYPEVYDEAVRFFDGIAKDRMLAVGDNLATDIRGANAHGIDSCLVTGGVLSIELRLKGEDAGDPDTIRSVCRKEGEEPDYIIPGLKWTLEKGEEAVGQKAQA